jgi:hypothetical protein
MEFQVANHSPEVKTENHWCKRSLMDEFSIGYRISDRTACNDVIVMMSPIKRM